MLSCQLMLTPLLCDGFWLPCMPYLHFLDIYGSKKTRVQICKSAPPFQSMNNNLMQWNKNSSSTASSRRRFANSSPMWKQNACVDQGCQMVSFQTKNPNWGKCWRALDWKMLIYFMAIWNILQTLGIFYDQLVHFVFIWYIILVWVIFSKKNLATLTWTAVSWIHVINIFRQNLVCSEWHCCIDFLSNRFFTKRIK
jgi:hypothetical protein